MSTALWYASRGTGLVALVLLTAVVVLGAANAARFAARGWPRFALAEVHRGLSLLTVAFLAVHVSTAIIDPYAGIRWVSVLVPFSSAYQGFWLGLGSIAFDLLLALVVSSLLRPRISLRWWRLVHWAAYVCWPVAVVHGFGIGGADARLGWVRVLTAACVLAVPAAVGWRIRSSHADTEARRDGEFR
ncbi:ferric reductase-like transmembrane domain-containing protein [Amycolatopsis mongoliensis]|uniref:Ferric reductase-like transmembrane domain-containing protein n=1 Tax=Amycolatopsis mongoliensis TaxID=715475 RepID=A0A9Y2NBH2_9PSEU|nr:ferric reductase-like transmembrane domain-containing protein [Amycolatopsis sp. 4-36]WIX98486.1 ferric reductase-like transmembrane domain-containing protein [Amycolatopsis sp. 4-36]